ncbi:hypothetical protein [Nocardiopsis ansamitocini]|uniref:Uncharacterized protein n=1 Tax=Nocardiopsis ansamitocini TaxID=1670832 RepID=A0A9W6PA80_9ACTN|nr:hypothetical protein [Nocardiopsis ansamitocini]GLU50474.1 hypothetical protein Nans01_48250 [Nocardiopsis ansamitocini]
MSTATTLGNRTATDGKKGGGEPNTRDTQDAELAALIRRLAAVRPEIATGWAPPARPPRPAEHFAPAPRPRPRRASAHRRPTREDFPVDRAALDTVALLRASAAGNHRPGDYWPRHTDARRRHRDARRTPLHRTARHAARLLRAACTATGAITLAAVIVSGILPDGWPW